MDVRGVANFFKRYIRNSNETESSFWINIVDILIVVIAVAALIYVYGLNMNTSLKIGVSLLLLIVTIRYVIKKYRVFTVQHEEKKGITRLVLLDEEGESVKEWYIQGETSLLIGKNSSQNEVDIDLSDAEYASLISKQHAVLNYAAGNWYIEDIDSKNGIGVKKANKSTKRRLENQTPYRIDSGDIIYIANTRILFK
ncbi:FHA domain-containing protein [Aneurinibacillus thermoaerophilus]|uniref:FHA domain-containing protein n=1 Tax=Aneurinibacillus thermoaerophilus TaxID=143495 RepID=A0ABX8YE06_ANETH|nr:hypothetical protein ACH33_11895 [Aneurinibacillus sp. XH2]QYY43937.1 FHA domain-containing protein [Aneurinibacillus thermoaerophilus]